MRIEKARPKPIRLIAPPKPPELRLARIRLPGGAELVLVVDPTLPPDTYRIVE